MKIKLSILLLSLFVCYQCSAQNFKTKYPQVGGRLADHTFTDLQNYPRKSFSINDYRGKWLVIDYWSESCASCIASFPKMDKLRKDFSGRAEVIMVGAYTKSSEKIKLIFDRQSKNHNLTFPVAFDSISFKKHYLANVPAIFVLNPQGVIVAKTIKIDSTTLSQLLEGKSPMLNKSYSDGEIRDEFLTGHDWKSPLLTTGLEANGGVDTSMIFRSVITKWTEQMGRQRIIGFGGFDESVIGVAEAIKKRLSDLFLIGYSGHDTFFPRDGYYGYLSSTVFAEVKDVSKFNNDLFAYSLKMPSSTPIIAKEFLLDDLHRYFNYSSTIENREVDVFKLVISNPKLAEKNLRTLGFEKSLEKVKKEVNDKFYINEDSSVTQILQDDLSLRIYNFSMKRFINERFFHKAVATQYGFDYQNVPPVIDETGIDFKIDFEFIGDTRDMEDVVANLKRYGLSLVKGKALMKCIVVRDAPVLQNSLSKQP